MCSSRSGPCFCLCRRPSPAWQGPPTSYLPPREEKPDATLGPGVSWLRVTSVLGPWTLPLAKEGPKSHSCVHLPRALSAGA